MRDPNPRSGWSGPFIWLLVAAFLGCSSVRPRSPRAPNEVTAVGGGTEKQTYGVVEQLNVDAVGIRMVLATATRCRAWPLASDERSWLRPNDATDAGCRLRRYGGPLTVYVRRNGGHPVPALTIRTDENGGAELSFADVEAALWTQQKASGLDAFATLLLGTQGWAGVVDLQRLRRLWADRFARAVMMGRGSPRLFAMRHPDHPAAPVARGLALEATLARQEHDYLAVVAGTLRPWIFLRRYPWSPYRRAVSAMRTEAQR